MPLGTEDDKQALIERVAGDAAGTVDPGFVRALYRHVAAQDLMQRPAQALRAAAASLWQFMAERRPGRARLRLLGEHGPAVVEIVNDDMPFLVDSVTAALNGMGLTVQLLIHPVVTVARDVEGRLLGLADGGAAGLRESVMRIELARPVGAAQAAVVLGQLDAVLADVRLAVLDWAAMRRKALEIADGLPGQMLPVAPDEVAEVAEFLRWLTRDNFTFIGGRDYVLGADGLAVVRGSGRGVLRDDSVLVFDGLRHLASLSPDVQQFLRSPQLMLVTRSNRRSTVHRPSLLDTVMLKTFDAAGQVSGQQLLVGLFTSASLACPAHEIPVLRRKIRRCLERSGFAPDSHDGKALQHVLDTFPRDELFPIEEAELFATALGVVHLQERQQVALFTRRDPFGRFVSCLVYVPRERYTPAIRRHMAEILAEAYGGTLAGEATHLDQAEPLARIHFTIASPAARPVLEPAETERRLAEASRSWADRLGEALGRALGDERALALMHRFVDALPTAYTERVPVAAAIADILQVEAVEQGLPVAVRLEPDPDGSGRLGLRAFHPGEPIALSDVLPVLENFGLRVIEEIPTEIRPRDAARPVWLQEFRLALHAGRAATPAARAAFEAAFAEAWSGAIEDDALNRLIFSAGLAARDIVVLRAYARFLRQAGASFSQSYVEDTLDAYPEIALGLVRLFAARFDPAGPAERGAAAAAIEAELAARLDAVANLDQDRILRSFLTLISHSLRTNHYQRDAAGAPKPYLSIKLASRELDLLPQPRPLVEITVYSPRMEGCHLRGGKVARGGIRWSDRREDFRTEVLGLMKAQMVKNAVIVPVGSKGGFVVKRPPAGREALQAEVVACYRTLMSGLLDLTDTIRGDAVVPPEDVVRRDGDDPYLVVAADKGTATFSDIANGVARDYGFWLDDAFASGGSAGYDHKAMGITARGAWEAVKRHFRELGRDIQAEGFTCIGVGDMSGDVFGNGMLLSRHTRLIAAFNHEHIFIDPDPDPAASWAERQRLFRLPRSGWADYDARLLSPGGAIHARSAKAIQLSPEARQRLGLGPERLSPAELIQALLRQPVDLLWFGGIGTYVKASHESHAEAGDRANDALRVDARTLRAAVIGEGANLAVTQRGRIEYALKGGRINTDAIDNSAGVDTSDHEVNIKIALAAMIGSGALPAAERDPFLAAMTDEVAALVLRDNYLQTQALSLAEAEAADTLDQHGRMIRALERAGRLDRALEFLPDEEELARRATARRGLTRPELAVLLAYGKLALFDALIASDLPDAPELTATLTAYFPPAMRERDPAALAGHRLRREIIATGLANEIVNRMGPAFAPELQARTGADAAAVARAFRIGSEIFRLDEIWRAIEALDGVVPAQTQLALLAEVNAVAERIARWLLQFAAPLAIGPTVGAFAPGIARLAGTLPDLLPPGERRGFAGREAPFLKDGVPADLVRRVVALANLAAGLDILRIDAGAGTDIVVLGQLYYDAGERFGLDGLRDIARAMSPASHWQRLAIGALLDDFYLLQGEIARHALAAGDGAPAERLERWVAGRAETVARIQELLTEIGRAEAPDLAMLTVASRQLRALTL